MILSGHVPGAWSEGGSGDRAPTRAKFFILRGLWRGLSDSREQVCGNRSDAAEGPGEGRQELLEALSPHL